MKAFVWAFLAVLALAGALIALIERPTVFILAVGLSYLIPFLFRKAIQANEELNSRWVQAIIDGTNKAKASKAKITQLAQAVEDAFFADTGSSQSPPKPNGWEVPAYQRKGLPDPQLVSVAQVTPALSTQPPSTSTTFG